MASLRRTTSQKLRDSSSRTNPTVIKTHHLSMPAAAPPPPLPEIVVDSHQPPFLVKALLAMAMEGSGKGGGVIKMSSWKKLLIQFGVCFVIGLSLGWFAPQKSQSYVPEKMGVAEGRSGEGDDLFGRSANAWMETTTMKRGVVSKDDVGKAFSGTLGTNMETILPPPSSPRKLLIVITPTYTRPFKHYYLTRLAHTLKRVPPPLLWLVVEMHSQAADTAALLRDTGLMYRHLVCDKNLTNVKDRGTHQRNTALAHIEQHQLDGVVYFADDDNVYTLELFEQMRKIRRFGTWLVGMLAPGKSRAILEGPVCEDEKVIGWHTNEKSKRLRRFHVDMSGFAFNSTILWDPRRWKRPTLEPIRQLDTIKEGFQETTFIEQLLPDESHMEGLPPGCLKVMVWHLHLEAPKGFAYPSGWTLTTPLAANIPLRKDN